MKWSHISHALDLAYFGVPSENNHINVLDCSLWFTYLLQWLEHDLGIMVNGNNYDCYYLLNDGIYLWWSIFIRVVHEPQGEHLQHFTKAQEVACKYFECWFGVLQVWLATITNPCHQWDHETIVNIFMMYNFT